MAKKSKKRGLTLSYEQAFEAFLDWNTEDLDALAVLVNETNSSLLAFALYEDSAGRKRAAAELKQRLHTEVAEFTCSAKTTDPIRMLLELPQKKRMCVFFFDIEDALPDLAGHVNLQREVLTTVPHAVVFWVLESGMRELAERAPDFWAWRSGVFDFRPGKAGLSAPKLKAALADLTEFQDRGEAERRLKMYDRLLSEYSESDKPDEEFLARTEAKMARSLYVLGLYDRAEESSKRALERSRRIGDRAIELEAIRVLAEVAIYTEPQPFDKAEPLLKEGMAIAREVGNRLAEAELLELWADLKFRRGDLSGARAAYRDAFGMYKSLSHTQGLASVYYRLSQISAAQRDYEEAKESALQALELHRKDTGMGKSALALSQLSRIEFEQRRFEEAAKYSQEALSIYESLGLETNLAGEWWQLARLAYEQRRFDEAEDLCQRALAIYERLGSERDLAAVYYELGAIARARGNPDKARDRYLNALEIFEKLDTPEEALVTYLSLGNLALKQDRLAEAKESYLSALKLYERAQYPQLGVATMRGLARVHLNEGMAEEAVKYLGMGWSIAAHAQMDARDFLSGLALLLREMGERDFRKVWTAVFPEEEPPLKMIRESLKEILRRKK